MENIKERVGAVRAPADVEVRIFHVARRQAEGEGDPIIEGNAAVYNVPSEDMGFIEIIEPGFFDDVLEDDTRALFNHDTNYVLGRRSVNTLELHDTPEALGVTIHPPKTTLVNDMVLEPMRRGDIDQMSFAFRVKVDGDEWVMKEGKVHRFMKKGGCQELYDCSVVTYPAYPQTSAQVRSRAEAMQKDVSSVQLPLQPAGGDAPSAAELATRHANRKRRLQIESLK